MFRLPSGGEEARGLAARKTLDATDTEQIFMPRKRNIVPSTAIDVQVPSHILRAVDDRLFDPRLGKPAYGARSDLIARLLADWLERNPLNPHIAKLKAEEAADAAAKL